MKLKSYLIWFRDPSGRIRDENNSFVGTCIVKALSAQDAVDIWKLNTSRQWYAPEFLKVEALPTGKESK